MALLLQSRHRQPAAAAGPFWRSLSQEMLVVDLTRFLYALHWRGAAIGPELAVSLKALSLQVPRAVGPDQAGAMIGAGCFAIPI